MKLDNTAEYIHSKGYMEMREHDSKADQLGEESNPPKEKSRRRTIGNRIVLLALIFILII